MAGLFCTKLLNHSPNKAVDAAYGYKGKKDDASRAAFLFGLYRQVTPA